MELNIQWTSLKKLLEKQKKQDSDEEKISAAPYNRLSEALEAIRRSSERREKSIVESID
jgi:hypothetical protein